MADFEYYTVTLDHTEPKDGWHTRALMIVKAENGEDALYRFGLLYSHHYANSAKATKGIHIEDGFHDLITEGTQKIIVKVKGGSQSAPASFSYSNAISVRQAA